MEYSNVTDQIKISKMSMGTWGFSGAKLWGESDDELSVRTVHMALDNGINAFDVAERYGEGRAENILGKAVKGRRDKVVIGSKIYTSHLKYDDVMSHCEESLRRLGTDYIDIYQIHWPSREISPDETMGAFLKLRQDGKIREIGVCNFGPENLKSVGKYPIVSNQLPYSLIWRVIETNKILESSQDAGLSVWAYCPLAQGLLTGKFKTVDDVPLNRRETRFYSGAWKQGRHNDTGFEEEIFSFLPKLQSIVERTNIPMSALAFAFLKNQPGVASVLTGSRNPEQLLQNIKYFETPVPREILEEITVLSEPLRKAMGTNADLWEDKDGGRMF
jgi:myo-inositol catabolism protein IolS